MEKGIESRRQQFDKKTKHNRSPPKGLQHNEKNQHPEADFSWPLNIDVN